MRLQRNYFEVEACCFVGVLMCRLSYWNIHFINIVRNHRLGTDERKYSYYLAQEVAKLSNFSILVEVCKI